MDSSYGQADRHFPIEHSRISVSATVSHYIPANRQSRHPKAKRNQHTRYLLCPTEANTPVNKRLHDFTVAVAC